MDGGIGIVVQLSGAESRRDWAARCRRAEAAGAAGISMPDHLGPQLAPLVALAAAATVTEQVTLGTNMLAVDFRHPVVLASELATLDDLSGGRVVAGIGAGWMRADYERSGIPMAPAGERIRRAVDAVRLLRTHWPSGTVAMGGGGRRVLTEAGRIADVVGLALVNRSGTPASPATWQGAVGAAVDERVAWVRAAAARRDPSLGSPRLSLRVLHAEVTESDARRDEAVKELARRSGLSPAEVADSPHLLVGPVGEIVARMQRARDELGIAEWVISERDLGSFAPVLDAVAS